MILFDIFIYGVFILMSCLKYYAISRNSIQDLSSLVIVFISIYFITTNTRLIKKALPATCLLYLLSLFLSSVHLSYDLVFDDFLNSLLFPLIFLTSYIFFGKYPKYLNVMKYIGIVALILSYYNLLRLSAMVNERTSVVIQSNSGNAVVALLPFAFLWKNNIMKYAFIIVVFISCLIAIKRSAFVIFVVVLFLFLLLRKKTNLLKGAITYSLILLLAGIYFLPRIDAAERMIERLELTAEDGGSGRDVLAIRCLKYQLESTFPEWILGNGYLSFSQESKQNGFFFTGVHNDFVEVLYSHGIISYVLYILFICYSLKLVIRKQKEDNPLLVPLSSCLVVFLLSALLVGSSVHFWYYLPMYCLFGGLCSISEIKK